MGDCPKTIISYKLFPAEGGEKLINTFFQPACGGLKERKNYFFYKLIPTYSTGKSKYKGLFHF